LGPAAGDAPQRQPGRQHLRLVDDQQIPRTQELGQVADLMVVGRGPPPVDEQAGGVAGFDRRLGDRLRGELVVEVAGTHPAGAYERVWDDAAMTTSRTVSVPCDEAGAMPLHVWVPPSGSGPGILLVQEIFGVGPYIRAVAQRLCGAGYVV